MRHFTACLVASAALALAGCSRDEEDAAVEEESGTDLQVSAELDNPPENLEDAIGQGSLPAAAGSRRTARGQAGGFGGSRAPHTLL